MPATPITAPAAGESLVGTEPQLLQQVDPGWRHRLNLFTGRALSDTALDGEQAYRAGLLATLGQSLTAGTVSGLALSIDSLAADPVITVSPGYGVSASGQDVTLNSPLKTSLSTLAVIDPIYGKQKLTFREFVLDPANKTYAGILILQPVIAEVSGQVLDTGGPIVVSGNLGASCSQDPAEYAFEDWQIVDAVRLVFLPWPTGINSLPLPPVAPQATWRNRLAYSIFEAEAMLGPDDQLPWAMLGVPVALAGFDPGDAWAASTAFAAGQFITDPSGNVQLVQTAGTSAATAPTSWSTVYGGTTTDGGVTWVNNGLAWKPLFVDCSSVVRAGGLPRKRSVLPAQPPPLRLWQSGTPYILGNFIVDPNGNVQKVQTAGSSGGPPPAWAAAFGATTTDGTITWINNGPGSWKSGTAFAVGQFVIDSNGNLEIVETAGVTGATAPAWNAVYLPTFDGGVTWVNNGSGASPIVQPALAQARINQLSEQLSQSLTQPLPFTSLADIMPTMPPSGILPATAVDFKRRFATWFPRNWIVSAAPVFLEELETALQTGMTTSPIEALSVAPADPNLREPVELLVPLPDAVYDPNILVTESVAPVFQQEVDKATLARDLTLADLKAIEQELNALNFALGPNAPSNFSLIDPDAGLNAQEIQGRNAQPPYTPGPSEAFGTLLESTWLPSKAYATGQFVVDSNGTVQVVKTAGTSGAESPFWNTVTGQTTEDGILWINSGKAAWQPGNPINAGQFIIDSAGNIQMAQIGGLSGGAAPVWSATVGAQTKDNTVTWECLGKGAWQASQSVAAGQVIIDPNGFIQLAQVGGNSGTAQPAWSRAFHAITNDGVLTWLNNGPWSWQPNTPYVNGQLVVGTGGFIQMCDGAGTSAASSPQWNQAIGGATSDGITWLEAGNSLWRADTTYASGTVIFDAQGNIQVVQTSGISGDAAPAWNGGVGQTTQDSGVSWKCLGRFSWQPGTVYSAGQAIVDSNGFIELVHVAGTSGANQPAWNPYGGYTQETAVAWLNMSPITWQPGKSIFAGQIVLDSNGNLQVAQNAGTSGAQPPTWSTVPSQATADGNVTWSLVAYYSTQLVQLQQVAAQPPYTIGFKDSQGNQHSIALVSGSDFAFLESNGLVSFIAMLNARVSQANDLLDTSFLTSQTDIYRYRQHVLGATAASVLATSPILANIATGETAAATSTNLKEYISGLQGTTTAATGAVAVKATPTFTRPNIQPVKTPIGSGGHPMAMASKGTAAALQPKALRSQAVIANLGASRSGIFTSGFGGSSTITPLSSFGSIGSIGSIGAIGSGQTFGGAAGGGLSKSPASNTPIKEINLSGSSSSQLNLAGLGKFATISGPEGMAKNLGTISSPSQIIIPGQNAPATSNDITNQSPIVGAQINIRTLTVAQRLAESPSQEAMFYSISNRLSFLQVLQILANDLNIAIDDLPILVDGPPPPAPAAGTPPPPPQPVPVETHTFSEWLDPVFRPTLHTKLQAPYLAPDSAEATVFSVGVRVLEQHTMMLRAIEARIQQYADFVSLCNSVLGSIQSSIQQAQTHIMQLRNRLMQDRQDVSFTTSLLGDENQRVNTVNAQRQQVLATQVQLIAYTRPRSLQATATAPSRQLVPANISNPVPACLRQSVSIPAELREIVGQLREAPVSWMPAIAQLLRSLERPILLHELALSIQVRATQQLQYAALPSTAAGESGVYSSAIANVYSANQMVFRSYQSQRASFQPAAIANLSWSLQVASLQAIAAANDLIASNAVHTEVSNATARLIQQISSVATCVYTRAGIALPIDRLAWAEYLSGPGASASLQSLATLPKWNELTYIDRQQMQLLVDWLFQQIDTGNSSAVAFMSDVVRTAILLASDVPLDNIIPGNILIRTLPVLGGMISLNLPSERIASGMYVHLFSGANLAARAVVTDLDTGRATATVTDVFQPGVYLEASDTAHFTALTPQAIALRPLMLRN